MSTSPPLRRRTLAPGQRVQVPVAGHPGGVRTRLGEVDTWWDVHGAGDPLVLLHPGGADSRAYDLNHPHGPG